MRGDPHVRFGEGGMKKRAGSNPETAPSPADPTTTFTLMDADGARLASRRLPEGLLLLVIPSSLITTGGGNFIIMGV